MKIKVLLLKFIMPGVLIAIAYLYYCGYKDKKNLQEGISCYSKVQYDYVSDKKIVVIQAGIFFWFSNGRGAISYSGELTDQNDVYIIRRDAEINYTMKGDGLFLIRTNKLKIAPFDTLPQILAKKHLYSYIREQDGWTNMRFQRNGSNGYLISTSPIPQLLCNIVK